MALIYAMIDCTVKIILVTICSVVTILGLFLAFVREKQSIKLGTSEQSEISTGKEGLKYKGYTGIVLVIIGILGAVLTLTAMRCDSSDIPRKKDQELSDSLEPNSVNTYDVDNIYNIILIKNDSGSHIRNMAAGFTRETEKIAKASNYQIKINERFGFPNIRDSLKNKKIFEKLIKDNKPDLIVSVGTNVSIYAVEHYSQNYPVFFLGVTNPVKSHLVSDGELQERSKNVSGFGNGIVLNDWARKFGECFPDRQFGFIYNSDQPQDTIVANYINQQRFINAIPIQVNTTIIPDDYLNKVQIFIGWNYLNTNIISFLKNNATVLIVGNDIENLKDGAIFYYGAKTSELGDSAARYVIPYLFEKKQPLSMLPVLQPNMVEWRYSSANARRRNATVTCNCINPKSK